MANQIIIFERSNRRIAALSIRAVLKKYAVDYVSGIIALGSDGGIAHERSQRGLMPIMKTWTVLRAARFLVLYV